MMTAALPRQLVLQCAQRTSAGLKPDNEDSIGIRLAEGSAAHIKGTALALADGVSSAEGGRIAAELAVTGFLTDFYATPDSWSIKTSADRVLQSINRWLHGRGQQYHEAHHGYLTTFTALVLRARAAHLFHVGDSRCYRIRGGLAEKLTTDHVLRVGKGEQLTRALGMDWRIDIDYRLTDIEAGDTFVIATDGLYRFVPQPALAHIAADHQRDITERCEALTALALENGSDDNLSIQIVDITAVPAADHEDSQNLLHQLPVPPLLERGQKLDGYVVIRELHASTRSQLYLVEDMATGNQMAMKTPAPGSEQDREYIEHFILEEWIGQRIDSPCVIKTISPSRPRKFLYTLVEYIEGETLDGWRKNNPQPSVQLVTRYAEQLVAGIRSLHRREVLHQDIKSDNVMLLTDGSLKIIDLGSAHAAGLDEEKKSRTPPGTREYSAPEFRTGESIGNRSDQFSLALLIYELLTGTHPYGEAYCQAETVRDFARLPYQSAGELNAHVPAWYDAALRKALSLKPDDRYESLSEFLADLKTPNLHLDYSRPRPLIERHPLRFWQFVAGVSLLGNLLLLAWLLH